MEWDTSAGTSDVITRENGLPDNEATDIGITPDGLVWVGTRYSGLAVYDGSEWKQYTTAQGLADDGISELNVSPEGVLWVGFYNGDVSTFDGKNWNTWGPSYGLQKYPPSFIDVSDPNKITVYSEGPAVILNGLVWTVADVQYSFLIADAAVTPDGAQWFAAVKGEGFAFDQSGLLEVRGGKQIIHMHCSHIHGTYAYSIAVNLSGVMWVGTDAGLVSFDGANWGTFTVQQGLPSNMVRDVAIGSDGRLWAGTDHGLALMGDTPLRWTVFAAPEKGPMQLSASIDLLALDPENVLWIYIQGAQVFDGIARFDGVTVSTFSKKELPVLNQVVSNILPSSDGSVWITTDRLILNYRAGKWKQYNAQTDFPFSRIEAAAIDFERPIVYRAGGYDRNPGRREVEEDSHLRRKFESAANPFRNGGREGRDGVGWIEAGAICVSGRGLEYFWRLGFNDDYQIIFVIRREGLGDFGRKSSSLSGWHVAGGSGRECNPLYSGRNCGRS